MDDLLVWLLTEKAQVIISGALGGVVRWLTLKERWTAGIVSIVVGSICAVYLGPLVQPVLTPFVQAVLTEQISRSSFTGFIVGVSGITLSGFVIDMVRARRREVEALHRNGPKGNRHGYLDPEIQKHLGHMLRDHYGNIHAVEPEGQRPRSSHEAEAHGD